MGPSSDRPVKPFRSKDAWAAWLERNHERSDGLWLKIAKKSSEIESVTHDEALDVALCYGWIDGQRDRFDGDYYLQRFTPRRSRSKWSKVNTERVTRLIEAGEMRPAGLAEIERAKKDGRWDAAYDPPSKIAVPRDLQAELDKDPSARAFFDSLNSINRYAILYRIQDAKRPETRARRIEKFMAMLRVGKQIHN